MPPPAPAIPADPLQIALGSVDKLLSLSSFVLTVVGVALALLAALLGVLAVWGWSTIHAKAVKAAKKVAEKRLDSYLKEEHFQNMLADKIDEIARKRLAGATLVVAPDERNPNDKGAFPEKPNPAREEGKK